jgi:thiamine kinase-like enzyme
MNEGMLRGLAETEPLPSIRLFRTILSNLPKHRIVFTHADLQARNVLVSRGNHGTEDHGKIKLTIIDWEYSGWYPEYWEFCNSLIFNTFRTEWLDVIQDTLDVYTNEYLLMRRIRSILFY